MRQRRWLEIIKDFEVDINYHPRKAKKVADALSRRPRISVNVIMTIPWELYLEIQKLDLEIFNHYPVVRYLGAMTIQSTLFERIIEPQQEDPEIIELII